MKIHEIKELLQWNSKPNYCYFTVCFNENGKPNYCFVFSQNKNVKNPWNESEECSNWVYCFHWSKLCSNSNWVYCMLTEISYMQTKLLLIVNKQSKIWKFHEKISKNLWKIIILIEIFVKNTAFMKSKNSNLVCSFHWSKLWSKSNWVYCFVFWKCCFFLNVNQISMYLFM